MVLILNVEISSYFLIQMATPRDADDDIQRYVDRVVANGLQDLHIRRQIALNYITQASSTAQVYVVKVLCFNNKDRNCVHVKFSLDADNTPHFQGRVENKTVAENLETF